MSLLPVDTDALERVCRSVALDSYGFLYASDQKEKIKTGYENAEKGVFNARSLSMSDLRPAMEEIAGEEFSDIEKIRDGVYYVDPFGAREGNNIKDELTNLFGQRLVVTGETLRSRFSLAIDDVDFFVDELVQRDYVRRVTAGKRDYYTIGPRLKEHADDVGLDARLRSEATHGKISHSDLENVIDVVATTDVIRYLDREGYIVDLDGEYLVEEAIDEYADYVAGEIAETVEDEFADSSYALRDDTFEEVLRQSIEGRVDVLSKARRIESDLLEAVEASLAERLGLNRDPRGIVTMQEPLDEFAESEARRILSEVKAEYDVFSSPSEFTERAADRFDDLHAASDPQVEEYIEDEVRERFERIVEEEQF